MSITLRNVKGSALTYGEMDTNFTFLSSSYVPVSVTSSMTVLSSSFSVSSSRAATSSFAVSSSVAISSSFAVSASWAPSNTVTLAVSSSGSTIYSTNPVTYGFSTDHSIILGRNAGLNATNAQQSNFLGYGAGYGASEAYNSNFLGNNAGDSAIFAGNSNFFGQNAGVNATSAGYSNFFGKESGYSSTSAYFSNFLGFQSGYSASSAYHSNFFGLYSGKKATNASYSTLLGYNVGYNVVAGASGIGSNNIIIGTNITLENGRNDSINLGGLIFGTGSYSTTTGNPFSGSANGRVGINQRIPEYTLDVSGSGRFTGGIVSNPTGSRREYASFGSLTTNTNELSGSSFGYFLPPGYLTYYINTNHSYNFVSTVYLYNLTNSGTRLNPAYNSTITIINKGGGNVASITTNPSDTGVTINRATTSETFTSCSLATNCYITLFVQDGNSPDWVILASGSLY